MKILYTISIVLLILLNQQSFAQTSKVALKLNALGGIGTTWHTVDFSDPSSYDSKKIAYSGGGGIGLEAGIGYKVLPQLMAEFSAAIQEVLGLQSVNSYTSSVFFNKKTLFAGVKYKIPLTKKARPLSLNFGTGAGYIIPGKLKITENDNYLGSIGYKNTLTFYGLSELEIPLRDFSINAGLRFRKVTFEADYSSKVNLESIDNEYKNFSGTGFDLYAGLNFTL